MPAGRRRSVALPVGTAAGPTQADEFVHSFMGKAGAGKSPRPVLARFGVAGPFMRWLFQDFD